MWGLCYIARAPVYCFMDEIVSLHGKVLQLMIKMVKASVVNKMKHTVGIYLASVFQLLVYKYCMVHTT